MRERVRPRATFANVVSLIALFVALGGVTYAAIQLPRNSVKSKHIAKGQVKSSDAKNDGLTGTDVLETSLGTVPEATNALHAGDVDGLSGADLYRTSTATVGGDFQDLGTLGSLTFRMKCLEDGGGSRTQLWVRSSRAGGTGMNRIMTDNDTLLVSGIDELAANTDQQLSAAFSNTATPAFTSVELDLAVPPVIIGNVESTSASFVLKAVDDVSALDCVVSGIAVSG